MTANLHCSALRHRRVDLFAFASLNRLLELSERDGSVQTTVSLEGVGATKAVTVPISVWWIGARPARVKQIQGRS